jgi:amidase
VLGLFEAARRDLEAAGAKVVDVDFPVVSNYEGDRPGAPTIFTRGLVSQAFMSRELLHLSAWAWDDFLDDNGDPALNRLADVDGTCIFPHPQGGCCADHRTGYDIAKLSARFGHPIKSFLEIPLWRGVRGLEGAACRPRGGWTLSAWTRSFSLRSRMSVPRTWTSTCRRPTSVGATASGLPTGTWRYGTLASRP